MKTIILESIKQYSSLNRILESVNISLLEMLELAQPIEKAIKDSGLEVPNEFKNIKKIDLSNIDDINNLLVILNNKQEMKIGRLLTQFFPHLKPNEIKKIISKVQSNLLQILNENYYFELHKDNIGKYYEKCLIDSCMTKDDSKHLPYNYDLMNSNGDHNISILVLYINNKISGRALVWHNVKGANKGMFMDRVYPADEKYSYIHEMFHEYANNKGWAFRENGNDKIYNGHNILEKDLSNVWDNINIMPYLDTFIYGDKIGLVSNIKLPENIYKFNKISGTTLDLFVEHITTLMNANNIPLTDVDNYFDIDSHSRIYFKENNKFEFSFIDFIKYIIDDLDEDNVMELQMLYNYLQIFLMDENDIKYDIYNDDYYIDIVKQEIDKNNTMSEESIYTITLNICLKYINKYKQVLLNNIEKYIPKDYRLKINNNNDLVCEIEFKKDNQLYDNIMVSIEELSEIPVAIGYGSFDGKISTNIVKNIDDILKGILSFDEFFKNDYKGK